MSEVDNLLYVKDCAVSKAKQAGAKEPYLMGYTNRKGYIAVAIGDTRRQKEEKKEEEGMPPRSVTIGPAERSSRTTIELFPPENYVVGISVRPNATAAKAEALEECRKMNLTGECKIVLTVYNP